MEDRIDLIVYNLSDLQLSELIEYLDTEPSEFREAGLDWKLLERLGFKRKVFEAKRWEERIQLHVKKEVFERFVKLVPC